MNKMVVIDVFEYSNACTVWYAHNHADDDPGKAFMDYLGIHHYHAHTDGFVNPQHTANKLSMRLGPYATTIIKLYYARQLPCGT